MSKELAYECQKIVDCDDPLILYACFIESALLRRRSDNINWVGFLQQKNGKILEFIKKKFFLIFSIIQK